MTFRGSSHHTNHPLVRHEADSQHTTHPQILQAGQTDPENLKTPNTTTQPSIEIVNTSHRVKHEANVALTLCKSLQAAQVQSPRFVFSRNVVVPRRGSSRLCSREVQIPVSCRSLCDQRNGLTYSSPRIAWIWRTSRWALRREERSRINGGAEPKRVGEMKNSDEQDFQNVSASFKDMLVACRDRRRTRKIELSNFTHVTPVTNGKRGTTR